MRRSFPRRSRVAKNTVHAAVVVGVHPGPVVVRELQAVEELSAAESGRARQERAAVEKAARRELDQMLRERLQVVDVSSARRCEIALGGEVGTLEVLDALDELGDEEVEVGIPLPVRVRPEVHRHAVERGEEVGAVVEVETAEEVLVRLSGSAVLRDDETRHELQHLARSQDRPIFHQLASDRACARGFGAPDCVLVVRRDLDLLPVLRSGGAGRRLFGARCGLGERDQQRAGAPGRTGPEVGLHERLRVCGRPRSKVCW